MIRSTKGFSGAERYNVNLFRELKKDRNFEVSFVTNLPELAKRLNATCYPWLPVEVGTKKQLLYVLFSAPVFISRYISTIKRLESGKRFDAVVLESRTEMIFFTPILKLLRYKVVWIQHGPLFRSQASRFVLQFYLLASKFV